MRELFMLFHLPKFLLKFVISHLNARVNEQKKNCTNNSISFGILQLVQQLAKEAKIRRKNNQKFLF
jgi:serine protease SohB